MKGTTINDHDIVLFSLDVFSHPVMILVVLESCCNFHV